MGESIFDSVGLSIFGGVRTIAEGRGKYGSTTLLSIPGYPGYTDATIPLTAGRIYYMPIYVRTPIVIDQVTIEVTSAAGAGEKARFAIYAADTDWQPGVQQVASAEIAIDGVAAVDTALTETVLQENRYLMAIIVEGNATLRTLRFQDMPMGFAPTLGATPCIDNLYVAQAYGALPDPGTAWDTVSAGSSMNTHCCFLQVKTP